MTDQFSLCLTAFQTQLRTISSPYFPAVTGRAAGWQVSENDLTPMEGGDYFIVLRPGTFGNPRRGGQVVENEWHITTLLYLRFSEYDNLWSLYRAFRSAVLELPDTIPIRTDGIWEQTFSAQGEPGFVIDTRRPPPDNYTDLVSQTLDCTIRQRVKIR